MAIQLTSRDFEILDALTKRVRVFSLDQIARTWWSGSSNSTRAAESRLRLLASDGLLKIERAPAHPELDFQSSVATWNPGEPDPDLGVVSYKLQSRWRLHPTLTPCISASKIAASRFGGHGGRPPRAVERTHDLHMARVYLLFRERHPELLPLWVFEEQVKAERRRAKSSFGEKLPDVLLRSDAGTHVIEFGGAYSKDKLLAFHAYCKDHFLPYEIW